MKIMQATSSATTMFLPQLPNAMTKMYSGQTSRPVSMGSNLLSINKANDSLAIGVNIAECVKDEHNSDTADVPAVNNFSMSKVKNESFVKSSNDTDILGQSHLEIDDGNEAPQLDGFKDLTSSLQLSMPKHSSQSSKSTASSSPFHITPGQTTCPPSLLPLICSDAARNNHANELYHNEEPSLRNSLTSEEELVLEKDKRAIYK